MSKIGQKPITIPQSVTVTLKDDLVTVKSGETQLSQAIPSGIKLEIKDNQVIVTRDSDARQLKALHGLTRSLVANMVQGVTEGFTKTLELQGTGYRVNQNQNSLELSLGFSHPVVFEIPSGLKAEVKDQKLITLTGADKQLVGQTAAKLRALRPPDAYKGKGIRYQGEVIKLKPGKAAKTGEGAAE